MTLCLGVVCREMVDGVAQPRIVLGWDEQIETNVAGAEIEHKFQWLTKDHKWCALYAGTVARAHDLIDAYRRHLSTVALTSANVLTELRKPMAIRRAEMVDHHVRMKLGLSYEEFLQTNWPEASMVPILNEIEALDLGAQLIVAGFIDSEPYVLAVNGESDTKDDLDKRTQFAAIGSGAVTAASMLFYRRHHEWVGFPRALYHLYEAQIFGRTAPGVGKTNVHISIMDPQHKGEVLRFMRRAGLEHLAGLFRKYGPQEVPAIGAEYGFTDTHFHEAQDRFGGSAFPSVIQWQSTPSVQEGRRDPEDPTHDQTVQPPSQG